MNGKLRAAIIAALLVCCALAPAVVAIANPTPVYVIRATTSDPATGTIRFGAAEGVTCRVDADAGSHAVTVHVRMVLPDGTALGWDEWTSAAGTATSADPYTVVIPYPLYELRIVVENSGGNSITAVCMPWGGAR